jgi:hypothetical protein
MSSQQKSINLKLHKCAKAHTCRCKNEPILPELMLSFDSFFDLALRHHPHYSNLRGNVGKNTQHFAIPGCKPKLCIFESLL